MSRRPVLIVVILLAVAACCGIYFAVEWAAADAEVREYDQIQSSYSEVVYDESAGESDAPVSETDGLPYTLVDFDSLLEQNPDTVGWITIPDTLINYPVVQTTNNSRYLNTSFSGTRSGAGAVFADAKNNMRELNQNTVLYGHNMGSGRTDMFGTLLYYNDAEHYDRHRYIQFDTIYEQHGWWKIFAVINHDVRSQDFDYLRLDFESTNEFMEWVATAQALSLYEADVEIQEDDWILTLSTCDRQFYGRSGRQLILAVKMNGGE
ncbi:class B sortase [Christensenellaceae bacterium OttesenSCG-928-K19]|nr:class B sortase [Christensenellaceae bacterium OttesenSCG-928-K19]